MCLFSSVTYGQQAQTVKLQTAIKKSITQAPSPVQALLQEGRWLANALITETRNDIYQLRHSASEKSKSVKPPSFIYHGIQLTLSEDGAFQSSFHSMYGIERFQNYEGRFEVVDENHIRLHLTQATQLGVCDSGELNCKTSLNLNLDLGLFLVEPSEDGFYLIRSQGRGTDAQQLHYWEKLAQVNEQSVQQEELYWHKIDADYHKQSAEQTLHTGLKKDGRFDLRQAQLRFVSEGKLIGYILYVFEVEGQLKIAAYHLGDNQFVVLDK